MSDPKTCKHLKFTSYCAVGRIVSDHELSAPENFKPTSLVIDLKIQCSDCGVPVLFTGLPLGSVRRGCSTSFDRIELRASGEVREF